MTHKPESDKGVNYKLFRDWCRANAYRIKIKTFEHKHKKSFLAFYAFYWDKGLKHFWLTQDWRKK